MASIIERIDLGLASNLLGVFISLTASYNVLIRYWFDIVCEWFSTLLTLATDLQYQELKNKQGE